MVIHVRLLASGILAWLCALSTGLVLLPAPASASRGHLFASTFGEPCPAMPCGDGQLTEPSGVAVDESGGRVYVVDKGDERVQYFSATGTYEGQFDGSATPAGDFSLPEGIAVDNSTSPSDLSAGDVYVLDAGHKAIDKFTATGEYLGQLTETPEGSFNELDGVAVDANGTVWVYQGNIAEGGMTSVADFNDEPANEFIASRSPATTGFLAPGPFAVDSEGNFYVNNFEGGQTQLTKYSQEGQILTSGFVEAPSSGAAVEATRNDVYVDELTSVVRLGPDTSLIETFGAGHLTSGSGVAVNTASATVYVADSEADDVDIFLPEPPSPPSVGNESVSEVASESADLEAEINPRGAATEYRFEYGTCTSAATCVAGSYEDSIPVPDAKLAAGFEAQDVSVQPLNLSADTVYHFRVIARNTVSGATLTEGEDQTFVTQGAGAGTGLLDNRAWELVSPADKHGALIEPIGEGQLTAASAGGDAMSYVAAAPTESGAQGFTNKVQVLSTRGAGGWQSRDIAPPHIAATGLSQSAGQEYRAFSSDLSSAVLQPFGAFIPPTSTQALAPAEASEQTAFLRSDFPAGNVGAPCLLSCFRPLVTGKAGYANVLEGTVFGQTGGGGRPCPPEVICGPEFVAATPDLSHVVLQSSVSLTAPVTAGGGLYEWSAGDLLPVSVLHGGEGSGNDPRLGNNGKVTRNAISADGSRVVWSEHGGEGHLYMRDTLRKETVQLDAVQEGASGENSPAPAFQFASSDGSKVFFTDRQRLTADSGGGGTSFSHKEDDLYECEITIVAGTLTCTLTDLTPIHSGESANVLDEAIGGDEAGTYVYFVANGVLTEQPATNGEQAVHGNCAGEASKPGALCNLYVDHFDGEKWQTSLVAVLSAEDYPDWNGKGSEFFLANMTARVSGNGRWLGFMSERKLTSSDTRDAVTGQADEEVYLYNAGSGSHPPALVCASCDPTGARPVGSEFGSMHFGLDGSEAWGSHRRLAASLPTWTSYTATGNAQYQSRYLSEEGRLFFNSNDALVPQDRNHTGDVYEYEPPAVGDCSPSQPSFSERAEGCVGLVSSGGSAEESGFLDASESGADVFFLTASKLSSLDGDTSLDVYDAHECTGASPCFTPPEGPPAPCHTSGTCRAESASEPSPFALPPSAAFSGVGNFAPPTPAKAKPLTRAQKLAKALNACRRKPKRRRAQCSRQAHRVYGPIQKAKKHRKGTR